MLDALVEQRREPATYPRIGVDRIQRPEGLDRASSRAKVRALARPMPLAAPVTIVALPSSRPIRASPDFAEAENLPSRVASLP